MDIQENGYTHGLDTIVDTIKKERPISAVYVRDFGFPWRVILIDESGKSLDKNFPGLSIQYNFGVPGVTTIKPIVRLDKQQVKWQSRRFKWKLFWTGACNENTHILDVLSTDLTPFGRFKKLMRSWKYILAR